MARSKPCCTFCQSAGSGQDGKDGDKACAGPGEAAAKQAKKTVPEVRPRFHRDVRF